MGELDGRAEGLTAVPEADVEELLRRLAPQVLGAVVRRYGHFDSSEDATQEALIAAAAQWPGGVRAHLLEMAGERDTARDGYLAAAALASNLPQQRYLYARAARPAGDR
jgi:predicted RNA polymerase sigma factor